MKSDVFRDGKVHVCEQMCSTCVFRPGNLMSLNPGRLRGMVDACLATDSVIPCHSTLYGQQDHQAICRGFYDRHKHNVMPLQLATAMDLIEEDPIP